MGVSIGWRPNDPKKLNYISGGSNFHGVLEELYGAFPITLKSSDIPKLEGIAACGHNGADELIEALMSQESIIVEAEW